MRVISIVAGTLTSIALTAPMAVAQSQDLPAMTPAEITAACAPTTSSSQAPHALRVVGGQDTVPRTIFGEYDTLVINGGSDAGVQLGAEFYLRRDSGGGAAYGMPSDRDILTDGWIRIVAVSASTSVARVERMCGAIYSNDYLEPYTPAPVLATPDTPMQPDFGDLAHVLGAPDAHRLAGANDYAIIDRGSEDGVAPGARFEFYRDLTALDPLLAAPAGSPLTAIGEGIVISSTSDRSIVRIVRSREAVQNGDYAAPEKP